MHTEQNFKELKENLYSAAFTYLKSVDPDYVQAYENGFEKFRSTKTIGLSQKWKDTFEALVAYEISRGKVEMASRLLSIEFPLSNITNSNWTEYHMEAWLNFAYSWENKPNVLSTVACRTLKKPPFMNEKMQISWKKFNDIRGRYVHRIGAAGAISDGPGWEEAIVAGIDVATSLGGYLGNDDKNKDNVAGYNILIKATEVQAINVDVFFGLLNKHLFQTPAKVSQ